MVGGRDGPEAVKPGSPKESVIRGIGIDDMKLCYGEDRPDGDGHLDVSHRLVSLVAETGNCNGVVYEVPPRDSSFLHGCKGHNIEGGSPIHESPLEIFPIDGDGYVEGTIMREW